MYVFLYMCLHHVIQPKKTQKTLLKRALIRQMIITIATEKIQTDRDSKENVMKIVCKTLDVLCFMYSNLRIIVFCFAIFAVNLLLLLLLLLFLCRYLLLIYWHFSKVNLKAMPNWLSITSV